MRRSRLRGLVDVTKRYLIAAAAHNLGRILLRLFGLGKPRSLQGNFGDDHAPRALALVAQLLVTLLTAFRRLRRALYIATKRFNALAPADSMQMRIRLFSTGC